jgi:peptidyl-prolyl cis-trans isomerase C
MSMMMGLLLIPGAPALGADAGTGAAADAAKTDEKAENPAVAIVNGKEIRREALNRELSLVTHRLKSQGRQISPEQRGTIEGNVLDNMIDRELLYQDALKNGFKPDEKAITAQIDQMKQKFPGDAEYQKALKMMNTTESDLRSNIAQSMVIQQLIEKKITPGIEITDVQGREFYDSHPELFKKSEQVKASHILIKADPSASEAEKAEARKKIEAVQEKLKKGEKFDALAKEYSEGPSNTKGGDLGYFGRGQMVKPFEDAAFAMNKGDISDIVVTQFGFHLIQVMDKKPASTARYEDAKSQIDDHLKQQKMIESVNAYIEKIKADAKIKVLL